MIGPFIDTVASRCGIGLMSGTSCDGIDVAVVEMSGCGPDFEAGLVAFDTLPYPPGLRVRLLAPSMDARDITLLSFELGGRLAEAAVRGKAMAEEAGLAAAFVASHGHTIAHYPPGKDANGVGTLQIGEPAVIAERTSLPVVSDFRPRDIAAGGQGAPLVPCADWLLFRREDATVVTLNIGGIANFTVVTPELEDVVAFDSGPGNMAIDAAVRHVTRGAEHMDADGATAAIGSVADEFFDALLKHPYFQKEPPKSTGREDFGHDVFLRDAIESRKLYSNEDIVATVTAVVAESIARAYNDFVVPRRDIARLIVSGGGVRNKTLMRMLKEALPGVNLRTSDQYGIPSDAREAIAFAILGSETLAGNPANLPKATGARRPVFLGKITPA